MELEHAPEGLQLLQSILKNEEYSSLAQGLTECSDVDDFEAFVNRKLEQLLRLFRDLVDDYKVILGVCNRNIIPLLWLANINGSLGRPTRATQAAKGINPNT